MIAFGVGVGGSGGTFFELFSWRSTISPAWRTQSTQMLPSAPGMTATSREERPQNEQTRSGSFI